MLWVALHLPRLPPGTLEHVAAWACQFTPRVSLEPPHGLLLEVEGSLRLFGGLERLLERLREGLDAMELTAQLAVAPAARAALWRSRGGGARSEEHTSELQSPCNLVCRLLLEKKKKKKNIENSRQLSSKNGE